MKFWDASAIVPLLIAEATLVVDDRTIYSNALLRVTELSASVTALTVPASRPFAGL